MINHLFCNSPSTFIPLCYRLNILVFNRTQLLICQRLLIIKPICLIHYSCFQEVSDHSSIRKISIFGSRKSLHLMQPNKPRNKADSTSELHQTLPHLLNPVYLLLRQYFQLTRITGTSSLMLFFCATIIMTTSSTYANALFISNLQLFNPNVQITVSYFIKFSNFLPKRTP